MRALPPPRAWLVIAIFLALAVSAFAEFSVAYTGPVCTVTAPNGQQTQIPATVTPDGWISVGAQSYYPGTKFEINGTIRATLTWIGTETGPDPQQMILQEDSEATYTSTSGAASNGLGDPCIVSSGGGSSQGSAWNVFTNDGVYTIRRRVSVRGEITASSGFGGVWLRYRVTPTPILPVVQGAVWHDNQFKCLPGHKLILSVNTGTYAQTGHNWTPRDMSLIFKGVTVGATSRAVVPLENPADLRNSTLQFFVSSPESYVRADLSVFILTPEGNLSVDLSIIASVAGFKAGTSFLLTGQSDARVLSTGTPSQLSGIIFDSSNGNVKGFDITATLINQQLPLLFESPGTWFFSQLINSEVRIDSDPVYSTQGFELDVAYVYPFQTPTQESPAIETSRRFWDSPAAVVTFANLEGKSEVTVTFNADLFGVYMPPENGVGRIAVPIARVQWRWSPTFRLVNGQWSPVEIDPQVPTGNPQPVNRWEAGNFNRDYVWNSVALP